MNRARRPELTPVEEAMDFGAWVRDELPLVAHSSGDEWVCVCPRCGEEKLAINVRRKAYQCWLCGFAGYSPARLIMAVRDCHPAEAGQVCAQYATGLRALGRVARLDDAAFELRAGPLPAAPLPPGTTWASLDPATAAYAHSRGIPSEHAWRFGLCSVRGDGRGTLAETMTAGRLLIPVWDPRGTCVYWVARATGAAKAKTVNLPEACNGRTHKDGPECRGDRDCTCRHERWGLSPVPRCAGKSECLVGYHLLRSGAPAYLVEGPIDAAVCGPGFIGTMGATLSLEQAYLIAEAGVSEVIVLFDPDSAGRKGALSALELLAPIVPARVAELPEGRDPGDLGRAACLAYAARARTHVVHALQPPRVRRLELRGSEPGIKALTE